VIFVALMLGSGTMASVLNRTKQYIATLRKIQSDMLFMHGISKHSSIGKGEGQILAAGTYISKV